VDDWGDNDDSGWDDNDEIDMLNEVWSDNAHWNEKNVDLTLTELNK